MITRLKKVFFVSAFLSFTSTSFSQNFPGYRSGRYTGVNGVFSNPANIANNPYRWDVNLLSVNGNIGNSSASFNLQDLGSAFGGDVDSMFFGNSDNTTSALIATEVVGPSVMFNAGKGNTFALTSRVRVFGNIQDLEGNFVKSIGNENEILPININSNKNQKISINAWSEIGASFGKQLFTNQTHSLKGGLSVKYLAGSANSFAYISNLKGTLDEDAQGDIYLTNGSGRVAIGVSGVDFDDFETDNLTQSNGKGVGFDLGLSYEYRPQNRKDYLLKVGLALLDVGAIKYTPNAGQYGDYNINVPSGSRWYPADLDGKSISEIKQELDASPYFTNNAQSANTYTSKLPTTLQTTVDWAIGSKFYTELAAQLNMTKKDDAYGAFQYNVVTLTPRFENRHFGFYLPVNYNSLTNLNVGFSMRLGPFFIGSGSILTAALGQSKQADVFLGFRFGGLKKK